MLMPTAWSKSMGRRWHRALARKIGVSLILLFALPFEAASVLIATGDGTGNTTPPTADPGFNNVGSIYAPPTVGSGVYVGNGWVLTADHVGEKPIKFLGVTYQPVPGSGVQFQNPDLSFVDLKAFKLLDAKPPLPALAITDAATSVNTLVTVIGNGVSRGTATSWSGINGWNWAPGWTVRWGTNRIFDIDADGTYGLPSQSFSIRFDDIPSGPPGQHEAALVHGDSGGAAFTGSGASSELIGILYSALAPGDQPASTSLFGNLGLVVDLFPYRNAILALIGQADCNDGLDDDGDGLIDYPADPGCTSAADDNERGPGFQCDNGIDDDADGFFDFPNDPDCDGPTDPLEAPVQVPTGALGPSALVLGSLLALARQARGRRSHID